MYESKVEAALSPIAAYDSAMDVGGLFQITAIVRQAERGKESTDYYTPNPSRTFRGDQETGGIVIINSSTRTPCQRAAVDIEDVHVLVYFKPYVS